MLFALLALSAVVPSILLILFFHKKDLNPEPAKVMWATFGLGVLTIPLVLLTVLPLEAVMHIDDIRDPVLGGFLQAFLHAGIPEEFFKFCVVYFYARRHVAFDEPMDGIVYGATASLGFATLENILYVGSGGVGVGVLRAFTAVPGHAFCGVIMGYYVGQAKFNPARRGRSLVLALLIPIILHGLYDFPLLAVALFQKHAEKGAEIPGSIAALLPITLVALAVEILVGLSLIKRLRKGQLAQHAMARGEHPELMYERPQLGRALAGWVLVTGGALTATAGGLGLGGVGLALLLVDDARKDIATTLILAVVAAVVTVVGFLVFLSGCFRLHRNQLASRGVPVSRR